MALSAELAKLATRAKQAEDGQDYCRDFTNHRADPSRQSIRPMPWQPMVKVARPLLASSGRALRCRNSLVLVKYCFISTPRSRPDAAAHRLARLSPRAAQL